MLRESHRPGIEPATYKLQVQRLTAEPPLKRVYMCVCADGTLPYHTRRRQLRRNIVESQL